MKRTVLTVFAAASLCACLVCIVFSVRSYFIADDLCWTRRSGPPHATTDRTINVYSSRGGLKLSVRDASRSQGDHLPAKAPASLESRPRRAREYPPPPEAPGFRVGGLGFALGQTPARRVILLPYWPVSLFLLLLPGAWLLKALRVARLRRMVRRKVCPDCRYDLRASTDRCPECGRAVGLGPLALRRPERAALLFMLAAPPATLLLMALLGAFSRPSAPAAPSGLTADAVGAPKPFDALRVHVRVTWTDQSSNETAFTVERTRVGGTWQVILCGPNETTLLDEGVEKGAVYEYLVFAVNDFGNSRPSNVVRVASDPRHP